jgi:predicted deacylase
MNTYFSNDYQEARNKFMEASYEIGAHTESFRASVVSSKGEPLYTDIASIGIENATNILVLMSGTHGVEGFAGSAIQTGVLRENIDYNSKQNVGIIMVHAINPYGFAHLRRVNEDNVDLNRNFIDYSKPLPTNQGYERLSDVISSKSISMWSDIKLQLHFLFYRLINGKAALQHAVSSGQYAYPKGLFYSGQFETWSNRILNEIVKNNLYAAKRAIVIDFHTGLGTYGNAEVILNVKSDTPAYKRAIKLWGDCVKTTAKGESVSVHLQNSIKLAIPKMIPQAEVTSVSLEFGTYPTKKVFMVLRAENWLHHYGGKNHPKTQKIKSELLRVFYPNANEWKSQVWNHGKEIVVQALRHFE